MLLFMLLSVLSDATAQQAQAPSGKKPQAAAVVRMIERGRYRMAIRTSNQILERHPSALGVRGLKGIALARMGRFADALPLLESSRDLSVYWERGGVAAHAASLRAAGHGREAWDVRKTQFHPLAREKFIVRIRCHGIDDLLSVGAVTEAVRLGSLAVGDSPDSSTAHAFYASALIADEQVERAEFHQWLAKQLSARKVPRIAINEARIAMMYGDVLGARRSWARARMMRKRDPRIAAWRAAWLREQGEVEDALSSLQGEALSQQQHPLLLAERVRLHRLLGQLDAASDAYETLSELFPEHPQLHRVALDSHRNGHQ